MIKEIHSAIGELAKQMLEIHEILDNIKIRFFELDKDKLTFGFIPKQKDWYLILWVQNLKKMIGQIRKTVAKDVLKQLWYKKKDWYLQERSQKRYKLGTEIRRENGEIEERIYTVLLVYGCTGSRTECITGTFSSIKIPHYPWPAWQVSVVAHMKWRRRRQQKKKKAEL